jgi:hypothetical protein
MDLGVHLVAVAILVLAMATAELLTKKHTEARS